MPEQRAPLFLRVLPYLDLAEKIFLTGILVGLLLSYLSMDKTVLKFSLISLSVTYFLSSFKVIEIPRKEDEQFGMTEMLAWLIVPKVLWIGYAVSLMGIYLFTLELDHDGHTRALLIGGVTIVIGLVVLGYAQLTGTKYLKYILPVVMRAIPLLLVDFYLLFTRSV